MQLLTLFTTPAALYSIIALLTTGLGTLSFHSCSTSKDYQTLQHTHLQTLHALQDCQETHIRIQHQLSQQAEQINSYNLASQQYKRHLQEKYATLQRELQERMLSSPAAAAAAVPCDYDLSLATSLLRTQGTKARP